VVLAASVQGLAIAVAMVMPSAWLIGWLLRVMVLPWWWRHGVAVDGW